MLGLGLGMGVGNKAPLLPVSAFPSIDPGALVLDSDGVVKQKVGDELLTMDEYSDAYFVDGVVVEIDGFAVLQNGVLVPVFISNENVQITVNESNEVEVL